MSHLLPPQEEHIAFITFVNFQTLKSDAKANFLLEYYEQMCPFLLVLFGQH